jgi:hypothetical protein
VKAPLGRARGGGSTCALAVARRHVPHSGEVGSGEENGDVRGDYDICRVAEIRAAAGMFLLWRAKYLLLGCQGSAPRGTS